MSEAARAQIDVLLALLDHGVPGAEVIRNADRLTAGSPAADRQLVMAVVQWHIVTGAGSTPEAKTPRRADEDGDCIPGHRVTDLTLTITGPAQPLFADSPRGVHSWRAKELGCLAADAENVLQTIRNDISSLYRKDSNPNPNDIERRLLAIGSQVARLLPEPLITYLKQGKARIVGLDVKADFDFPIELCRIDQNDRPLFLCDTTEIVRWYRDTQATYLRKSYAVRHIAFVVGRLNCGFDEEERGVLSGAAASEMTRRACSRQEVFGSIFARNDHQVLHYKGHIANGNSAPELSLVAGESLGLIEIGDNPAERAFFGNEPLVFLNGCDGALSSQLIGGKSSFPFRFAELGAAAVIATLWQVSEGPASAFTAAFYRHLRRGVHVSQAVKTAREALLRAARKLQEDGDNQSFMLYYLAAYAYVYYGPSDLTVTFK